MFDAAERALQALRALLPSDQRRLRITVGLVNNMPDSALKAAERQFVNYLEAAADYFDIRIQLFTLPGIDRGGDAREHIEQSYLDITRLPSMHMDALLVTGAVPIAPALTDEPFWPQLSDLVAWARTHTLSTLFSCLSAHAAVMSLDKIERRRLPEKLSGLYAVETQKDHWLFDGIGPRMQLPHSRYNALSERELAAAGYEVLSRSDAAGADIFMKNTPSTFLFFQGHPEYDYDTLLREFRRDVTRYLDGASVEYPRIPANYFTEAGYREAEAFGVRARASGDPALIKQFPNLNDAIAPHAHWKETAARLFRNWIGHVVGLKLERVRRAGVAA